MNASLKNLLLLNRKALVFYVFFFLITTQFQSQIANYVNNGGFEICNYCASTPSVVNAKYWNAIDTNKFMGILLSQNISPYLVPLSSFTYQWPRHGNNFLIGTEYFSNCPNQSCVGYPRNKLKQNLQNGKVYCFKMYVNLSNQSSYAIDAIGAYFADNSTDTISLCTLPITFLNPQIENPTSNVLSDTLNWTLISGTYTANGTEEYLILGNFKSSSVIDTQMVNPTNLPAKFSSYCYDDVSVIDIDLPAYAGPDVWGAPTTTVYLGRERDVGIDEACMWYKLPNTTTAIDTAAGITATIGVTTDTYVVRQEICGNVKWDTVTVNISGVGFGSSSNTTLSNVGSSAVENLIRLYPNPVNNSLNVEILLAKPDRYWAVETTTLKITNNLGQVIREEDVVFKDNTVTIQTNDLKNGIYFLTLSNNKFGSIRKRFVVSR